MGQMPAGIRAVTSMTVFWEVAGQDTKLLRSQVANVPDEPRPQLHSLKYVEWNASDASDGGSGRTVHLSRGLLTREEVICCLHTAKLTRPQSIPGEFYQTVDVPTLRAGVYNV